MKMRFLFLLLLFFVVFTGAVQAQTFDVRAFSRQRGFKAYQVKPTRKVVVERGRAFQPADAQSGAPQEAGKREYSQEKTDFQQNQKKRIQQTGIKIFQEKDEDKVLNFDVENPEFKKLNEIQKKNLVQRIKIE